MSRSEYRQQFVSRPSSTRTSSILQRVVHWIVKLRLAWIILIAFLFLSGCVRSQVAVTFKDANHGTIVQHVWLSSQLTGVSRTTADLWLKQMTERAEQLGGRTRHPSGRELIMTIPFYNAKDLTTKFDQFFQIVANARLDNDRNSVESLPATSHLQVQTNNFILWQRNRLQYDLDLRSLLNTLEATTATTLLDNSKDLLALQFVLNTSKGAESLDTSLPSTIRKQGKQFVWTLQPGEVNHLEAVFWVPSPIGIGAAMIVVLVLGGMFAKAWLNPSSLIELPSENLEVQ